MRYRLTIEYDGTPFCGWQSQREGGAVQDALAAAVKGFCGETATALGPGAPIPACMRAGKWRISTLKARQPPTS